MLIVIDFHFDTAGNLVGLQFIDTDAPAVKSMLAALRDNPSAQAAAGYSEWSNHPQYPGKTRWQVLLAEAGRLKDPIVRRMNLV